MRMGRTSGKYVLLRKKNVIDSSVYSQQTLAALFVSPLARRTLPRCHHLSGEVNFIVIPYTLHTLILPGLVGE